MARIRKEQRLANIHAEALREFDAVQSAVRDERLQCLEDRRFYSIAGAQWEGALGEQFENKPRFEVNKAHLAVIRIFNEYRNNRITVDFISKDGDEESKLADTCDGLFRADEQDSTAEEAYDNGFEEAVGGGYGAWRLRAEYEDEYDEENERQRICIEPIYDADSCVFFDLNSKRQDKADAKRCWVLNSMTVDSYIEEYEDDPASWPKEIQSTLFDWASPDKVFIAEYYRVEEGKETLVTFKAIDGSEDEYYLSELEDVEEPEEGEEPEASLMETLIATGHQETKRRKIKVKRVHKYLMSGSKILEDCGYIAGKCIPIVPVYGKRWFVDGIERCMGHVRLVKDAQRLKNMQFSKLAEISALSSVSKPVLTPQQIAGHQLMWAEDNLKDYPYLLINPLTDANGNELPSGPVAYTKPPEIPQALAALLQLTEQDMAEILGSSQQADKMISGVSGKAVELIQTRIDGQAFIYMSNMAKAVRRTGEIWLSMAKDVYAQDERKMKTVGGQGELGRIELMRPVLDAETGALEYENDLSKAALDVTVDVGPSSASRREATVRSLTGMMAITADPETLQVLQAMALRNMEGDGISDINEFYRKKLVGMGVIKPTDEEAQQMALAAQNQPKDPQTVYLEAAAANEEAKAMKAKADTVKTVADAEKIQAETAETLANMSIQSREHVIKLAQALSGNRGAATSPESQGANNG